VSAARGEGLRITATMTIVCALGAAVLGGIYAATERYGWSYRVHMEPAFDGNAQR